MQAKHESTQNNCNQGESKIIQITLITNKQPLHEEHTNDNDTFDGDDDNSRFGEGTNNNEEQEMFEVSLDVESSPNINMNEYKTNFNSDNTDNLSLCCDYT